MPTTPRPHSLADVEPGDCSTRWWVKSRTRGKRYLCDLASYDGNGRCQCEQFTIRIEPLIRSGRNIADALEAGAVQLREYHVGTFDVFRCSHIMVARSVLLDAFLAKLNETQKP